uniref:Transmembrane protein n=1 Tax=Amphora coffeiformis TaxID=265554 RepID=A0A7S3L2J3_9STRA
MSFPASHETMVLLPLQLSADGSTFMVSPESSSSSSSPQQQQQQRPILGADAAAATYDDDYAAATANQAGLPAGVPLLQLYVSFLGFCAAAWLVYLLLPRGCKKAYFQNRRQKRQQLQQHSKKNHIIPAADDDWFSFAPTILRGSGSAKKNPATTTNNNNNTAGSVVGSNFSVQDSILMETEARRRRDLQDEASDYERGVWEEIPVQEDHYLDTTAKTRNSTGFRPMGFAQLDADLENHETPAKKTNTLFTASSHIPSPNHPQVNPLPAEAVWRECYRRVQGTGMRLTAHGVQCPSKRIWLQYSVEETTLLWQTEFPRQVPSTAARASTVWVRGAMHRIPAGNVLYIDVGKKTTALMQTAASVAPSTCFSLLTQAGSLDLQANSKLERDAVVSALSYILDQVHVDTDWRRLYDESSTIVNGGAGSRVASEDRFYNPSTVGAMSAIASDMFPPGPNEI